MSLLDDLVQNAEEISAGYNNYRDLIQQPKNTDVVVPKGITVISDYAFYFCNFRSIVLPETLTTIGNWAFTDSNFTDTSLPESVTTIGRGAFQNCPFTSFTVPNGVTIIEDETFKSSKLVSINLPLSLITLSNRAFYLCAYLTTINIPASLAYLGVRIFMGCTALTNVTIENGFNCDGLNLSDSTLYSAETIVSCLEALADRTGETAYTITWGTQNLNKLTAEQIAIATNKNWNLA